MLGRWSQEKLKWFNSLQVWWIEWGGSKNHSTTGWQTDLNRPCITKVKEVITGEKSTTIVMEYVRRDEKSDREV